jgi:DNA-binding response OmpR family regulator
LKKKILVSVDAGETRVAVFESKGNAKPRVGELYVERRGSRSIVGNIYKGVVDNVLPGMEAAFVDIGLERNGFLHVDEIVLPGGEKVPRRGHGKGRSIAELIKPKQEVLVQVVKDPLKTKGARLSMQLSIAGRYLVFMPQGGGVGASRRLSDSERETKVLMLTAADTTDDLVDGLALGADDYLPKPFHWPELVARIRALGRRAGRARPPVLRHGDLELDPGRREARRGDRLLDLTPKEFGVLEALLSAGGQAVSTEALLERVWDEHADPFTNTVRMCVMTLRRKLGDPPVIQTVTGVGYRV